MFLLLVYLTRVRAVWLAAFRLEGVPSDVSTVGGGLGWRFVVSTVRRFFDVYSTLFDVDSMFPFYFRRFIDDLFHVLSIILSFLFDKLFGEFLRCFWRFWDDVSTLFDDFRLFGDAMFDVVGWCFSTF